ncbi:MAG: transglycosylase domain-containing protein [Streptococcus sp.]
MLLSKKNKLMRKLSEIILAIRATKEISKEIITLYLNKIYFVQH